MADANNTLFVRLMLKEVMKEVRKHTTVEERKKSWGYMYPRYTRVLDGAGEGEFHGPNGFYWSGQVYNVTHAKSEGWQAWLNAYHPEDDDNDVDPAGYGE